MSELVILFTESVIPAAEENVTSPASLIVSAVKVAAADDERFALLFNITGPAKLRFTVVKVPPIVTVPLV